MINKITHTHTHTHLLANIHEHMHARQHNSQRGSQTSQRPSDSVYVLQSLLLLFLYALLLLSQLLTLQLFVGVRACCALSKWVIWLHNTKLRSTRKHTHTHKYNCKLYRCGLVNKCGIVPQRHDCHQLLCAQKRTFKHKQAYTYKYI